MRSATTRATTSATAAASPRYVAAALRRARSLAKALTWERAALLTILALAAALDFYRLDQNGFGNTYYAATVRSMTLSGHNWLFASFDPGGFITVDKPPLGFWLQVASVWIFGFHGTSLILPQAVAGVVAVWLLYVAVRRVFGVPAALIGALALALAPINVVSNRDNTLETLVVAFVLGAAVAVTVAIERGSQRWLLAAGALVGLGFNVKMLEAYLVVPALAAAYLLAAPLPWRVRVRHLLAAGALMLVVSFAWVVAVDLVPAASRPYIGSSYHNSALDLVFAYNGLQRLVGTPWTHTPQPGSLTGAPGPLRLFASNLASQVAWLLPLALASLIAASGRPWRSWRGIVRDWRHWRERQVTPRAGALILWGLWLATMLIFFSAAVFINTYYLTLLSPAIAALVGAGLTALWAAPRGGRWRAWVLLAGVGATSVEQGVILSHNPDWNPWLLPLIGMLTGFAASALLILMLLRQLPERTVRGVKIAGAACLALAVGLGPLLWTFGSLHPDRYAGFPVAGPLTGDARLAPAATLPADPRLVAYLRQHADGAAFLVATVDAEAAAPIILATGAPVMAMGGYSGYDPILTPQTLAARVAGNDVRLFYLPSSNLTPQQARQLYPGVPDAATTYTNALTRWVAQRCIAVPPDQWGAPADQSHMLAMQLFDCSALVRPATAAR